MGRELYAVGVALCGMAIFLGLFGTAASGIWGSTDLGWWPWLMLFGGLGMVGLGLLRGRSGRGEK